MEDEPNNQENDDYFYGLVERVERREVYCSVLVGTVELMFPFSREVFDYEPKVGDRFKWYPTEEGTISIENIEIIESNDKPSLDESDLERLTGLFTSLT